MIKYLLSPDRWRSYLIYLLRTLLQKLDGSDWSPQRWEVEQLMYRYITCEDCMEVGKCIHSDCGCKMPERAHVRTDFCPTKKWGPQLNEQGWDNFKRVRNLKFKIIEDVQK